MKYGKREFQNRKKASVSQPKLIIIPFRELSDEGAKQKTTR